VLVSLTVSYLTPDCVAAAHQVARVFERNLANASVNIPTTPSLRRVHFSLTLFNPLARMGAESEPKAEYSRRDKTYYAPGTLDYADFVSMNWLARVEGVHRAAVGALDASSRFPLPNEVKQPLIVALRQALDASLGQPPADIAPLTSVWLTFEGDDPRPGVALMHPAHLHFGPWRFVEVTPDNVSDVRARYFSAPPIVTSFELYRSEAGQLRYHEAWIEGGAVLEHWGAAGDPGETRQHDAASDRSVEDILGHLRASAERQGFQPLPLDRHRCVVARCRVAGDGDEDDLDLRHQLEEALNQALCRVGLGFCDGGEIGGGEMAVFSYVTDLNLGLRAISEVLSGPDYRGFRAETRR
jgi:hypothetical protein